MQAAELRLIDIELGNEPAPVVMPKAEPGKVVVQPGSRLAEIRQLRRDDWHAYESNPALQREELALIEASLPKTAPVSTGSDGAASIQPAEGTSNE
jgi:hypothetical protein